MTFATITEALTNYLHIIVATIKNILTKLPFNDEIEILIAAVIIAYYIRSRSITETTLLIILTILTFIALKFA